MWLSLVAVLVAHFQTTLAMLVVVVLVVTGRQLRVNLPVEIQAQNQSWFSMLALRML
jgi:hypothetical protein